MIWLFHKISKKCYTKSWYRATDFIKLIENNRKKKFVYLNEYKNPSEEIVITFDGIYQNVYQYAFPFLKKQKIPFELFVVGKYVGKTNRFEYPIEPLCRFADWTELEEMKKNGGRLQYHSWSHVNLTVLSDNGLEKEIKPLFPCEYFAYPHGKFNNRIINIAKKYYSGAVSVNTGNNSSYQLLRKEICQKSAWLYLVTIMRNFLGKLLKVP